MYYILQFWQSWKNKWLVCCLLAVSLVIIVISGLVTRLAQAQVEADLTQAASPLEGMTDELNVITIASTYAYVGYGSRLMILDIYNPTAPVAISQVTVSANVITDIAISDGYAYVTDVESALHIVDVSNPFQPLLMGSVTLQSPNVAYGACDGSQATQVLVQAGVAYVVLDAACLLGYASSLHMVDVTAAAAPHEISHYVIDESQLYIVQFRVSVVEQQLYLAHGSHLKVLDISHPATPAVVADYALDFSWAADVTIVGPYAYILTTTGLYIFDISQPGTPVLVGHHVQLGDHVHVADNLAYIVKKAGYNTPGALYIIDIAFPSLPRLVGFYDEESAKDVAVTADYVYVTTGNLRVFDNLAAPLEVGLAYLSEVRAFQVVDNLAYVTTAVGLVVLDVGEPALPTMLGTTAACGDGQDIVVQGNLVYVGRPSGVCILDVSNPAAPLLLAEYVYVPGTGYDQTSVPALAVRGDVLYGVVLEQSCFYLGCLDHYYLSVLDVSNPALPTPIPLNGDIPDSPRAVSIVGDYAYFGSSASGLQIMDISALPTLSEVGRYQSAVAITDMVVAGAYAYTWLADNRLQVVAVEDPTLPTAVGYSEAFTQTYTFRGMAVDMGQVYALTYDHLYQIDVYDPTHPTTVVGYYFSPYWGETIEAQNGWLYLGYSKRWAILDPANLTSWAPLSIGDADCASARPASLAQATAAAGSYYAYLPAVFVEAPGSAYDLFLALDEVCGDTTFADASPYAHQGTCLSLSCPIAGMPGMGDTAVYFDGINDYIQIGNPADLNIEGEITLAAWIKPEGTDGIQNIIAHGYTINPAAEVFLRINDGHYEVGAWDGDDHLTRFPIPAADVGTWVHLAGVYDGAAWRLYRQGVEVAAAANEVGAVTVAGDWAIGAQGTGTARHFQGVIDEVMVVGRALRPWDILTYLDNPDFALHQ